VRKMVENIKFFIRTAKLIKVIRKHIFWPIIDCFSMYVTVLFHADRRRIGACGQFRSRDKDGGHTIRSVISENPMLYANFTTEVIAD